LRRIGDAATIGVCRDCSRSIVEDVRSFLMLLADILAEPKEIRRVLANGEEEEENGFRE
jgi:hypothetical protein